MAIADFKFEHVERSADVSTATRLRPKMSLVTVESWMTFRWLTQPRCGCHPRSTFPRVAEAATLGFGTEPLRGIRSLLRNLRFKLEFGDGNW